VVSSGDGSLEWRNSERLAGIDDVAAVKRTAGPDLIIQGSSTLYPQLLEAGLLDQLVLMIFPLTLGTGKKLLGEGTPAGAMRMTEHEVTSAGTIIATWAPAGEVPTGSFAGAEPSPVERERQRKRAEGSW
jgi:dihydrofolate reductase